jgi:transposase
VAPPTRLRQFAREKPFKERFCRALTAEDLKRIFFLRHGCHDDDSQVMLPYLQISRKLRIPFATLYVALKQYKLRNRTFVRGRENNSRPMHSRKLTVVARSYLLDRSTLEAWSGYSLRQRCTLLREVKGVSIQVTTLWDFYKREGIKYYKSSTTYARALNRPDLDAARNRFALQLSRLIANEQAVIYFDESSFNAWMRRTHTW